MNIGVNRKNTIGLIAGFLAYTLLNTLLGFTGDAAEMYQMIAIALMAWYQINNPILYWK